MISSDLISFANLRIALSFVLAPIILSTTMSFADAPIGARAEYVEGKVYTFRGNNNKKIVNVGTNFSEEDRLETGEDGIIEIRFDTGDIIRIDNNTSLLISSLRRNDNGDSKSIFKLIFGRVKSSVSKLVTDNSKFEYQTKAAIAGVAGTPPWIVEYLPETEQMNVDLLGKSGDPGEIYVIGFDPKKTLVRVLSGNGLTVYRGKAPGTPTAISPRRFRELSHTIPFRKETKSKGSDEKKPEGTSKIKKSISNANAVTKSKAAQTVSTTIKPDPTNVSTTESINHQTSSEQGTVGEVRGGGEPPPPAHYKIDLKYR